MWRGSTTRPARPSASTGCAQAAGAYAVGDHFERTALRRLIEDLLAQQAELTRGVMAFAGSAQAGDDAESARDAATSWAALRREKVDVAPRHDRRDRGLRRRLDLRQAHHRQRRACAKLAAEGGVSASA